MSETKRFSIQSTRIWGRWVGRQFVRCVGRTVWRFAKVIGCLIAIYLAVVLIGLIPVNRDFVPTDDGVEVFVVSNAVHADLVLPVANDVVDWRTVFPSDAFPPNAFNAHHRLAGSPTHIAIGWGDKGFFLLTPTWADLTPSVAAKALLWPSGTCLHVAMTHANDLPDSAKSVRISVDQYKRLVDSIQQSFPVGDTKRAIAINDVHYNHRDAFFEASGTYHCFNTCNSWAGRRLKAAGVKTPWFSPLPKTVYWYFP